MLVADLAERIEANMTAAVSGRMRFRAPATRLGELMILILIGLVIVAARIGMFITGFCDSRSNA